MNRLPHDIQIVLCPEGGFAASAYSIGAFSEGQTPNEAYKNLLDVIHELRGVRETQHLPHGARRQVGRHGDAGCAYPEMPHVPNAKTRAAMRELERGNLHSAKDVPSFLAKLNADD